MKEKINQTAGRLKQTVRAVGVGIATLTASFFMSAPAYAAGVQDSQIVKGTEQLIGDVTTWLMVLAPVVAGLLIIYFCIRRGMAGSEKVEQPHCGGGGVLHWRRTRFRHPEPDSRLLPVSRDTFRSTGDFRALLNKSFY